MCLFTSARNNYKITKLAYPTLLKITLKVNCFERLNLLKLYVYFVRAKDTYHFKRFNFSFYVFL